MDLDLKKTPLYDAHLRSGGRMTAFAGYDMPVQFKEGVLSEHRWTREHAGVFDVSHMGPCFLSLKTPSGDEDADHRTLATALEPLVCASLQGLKAGQIRYSVLLNETGGMLDDLMIARAPGADGARLYLVVNGAVKEDDFRLLAAEVGSAVRLERADDHALLAVQGPDAATVISGLFPGADALSFMTHRTFQRDGGDYLVARSGYTGEDGFEMLVPPAAAKGFYERLLEDPRVKPIGLGARDSLRLEAGLPLYGHDADATVSPVEAGLSFAIAKKRREAKTLRGADRLEAELSGQLSRRRMGLRILEGAPAREGAPIADASGEVVGQVTSGGFSPTLGYPIAMGFAPPPLTGPGTRLTVIVRGKAQAAEVVDLPFVPHRYVRKL